MFTFAHTDDSRKWADPRAFALSICSAADTLRSERGDSEQGAGERREVQGSEATHIAVLVRMFDAYVATAVGAFGRIQVLGCTDKQQRS